MILLRTNSLDVRRNLAVEAALLDRYAVAAKPMLFLWRSANAVVIGKNQNPWCEANLPLMQDEKCALARRISGGGAVYHDEGNLNYTFIMDRRLYKGDCMFGIVLAALKALGLNASRMGRTSIGVEGSKVSGNAFCYRRGAAMHHGTLLVSSDLEKMARYLRSGASEMNSRAISSHPAETVNLRDMLPNIGIGNVEAAVVQSAISGLGPIDERRGDEWIDALVQQDAVERMASWEWLYGHTPPFAFSIERQVCGMNVSLQANVTDGVIDKADIIVRDQSGSLLLESRLQSVRFDAEEIAERLRPAAAPVGTGFEHAVARAFLTA
jgi:lipoate-protein ligase A